MASDPRSGKSRPPGYTIEIQLQDLQVVIVGGGQVARRKLPDLLACGARVLLIDPNPAPGLSEHPSLTLQQRAYHATDLDGAWLVFAATNDTSLNAQIARDAKARGIFCNRVDNAHDSRFTSPARLQRPPLGISVSTSGCSPALASILRDRLADMIPGSWQLATRLLGAVRQKLLTEQVQVPYNQQVLLQIIEAGLLERLAAHDTAGVDRLLEQFFGAGFSLEDLQFSFPEGTS